MTGPITQAPRRPYLLRAMHEWITDCGQTPHIVVDAAAEGAVVPREHAKDGRIVLNVSYRATEGLDISNEMVTCHARFSGVNWHIQVPVNAVLGIYARETGQGMIFSEDDPTEPAPGDGGSNGNGGSGGDGGSTRPRLTVVK